MTGQDDPAMENSRVLEILSEAFFELSGFFSKKKILLLLE